jgi:hypothetical protein
MSDYVVHFTREDGGRTAYTNIMGILSAGVIRARNPFGIARPTAPAGTQHAVCFSEIPMHLVTRLAARRGDYGIGFTKAFLLERGGAPIWYLERGSPTALAVNQLVSMALSTPSTTSPIWTLTPFIDSPGSYTSGSYRFEWEREWRHVGDLEFQFSDPAFLVIPEALHRAARAFFQNAKDENFGPGYDCPFLDPRWDLARVQAALRSRPSTGSA